MKTYSLSVLLFLLVLSLGTCSDEGQMIKTTINENEYLEKGKSIAAATFATLSGNLQKAMQEGGVQNAVSYCNLAASPLVDSLAKVYKADIRRSAILTRNPANNPTAAELSQFKIYRTTHKAGKTMNPAVQSIDANTVAFYAPIQLMPLCEKCHGVVGETIAAEDYQLIKQLYPQDEAINFKTGDLRGMWSISFQK